MVFCFLYGGRIVCNGGLGGFGGVGRGGGMFGGMVGGNSGVLGRRGIFWGVVSDCKMAYKLVDEICFFFFGVGGLPGVLVVLLFFFCQCFC